MVPSTVKTTVATLGACLIPLVSMSGFLTSKVAVVTGATKGIGKAVAETLAREGASVAICGRSQTEVDAVSKDLTASTGSSVSGIAADVRQPDTVATFFKFVDDAFGGLDILVNNAGIGIFSPVAELDFEDWKATLDTNLSGVFYCCKEGIPRLDKTRWRIHHQHKQSGGKKSLFWWRRLQCVEIWTQWLL